MASERLEIGDDVYINPAWCRCGRGGVCRVEWTGGAHGVRLIRLEANATEYGQHYLLENQSRWKAMQPALRSGALNAASHAIGQKDGHNLNSEV